MARSFEERQITEDIIDKEHRDVVCIRWANSSPCRIELLLESRIKTAFEGRSLRGQNHQLPMQSVDLGKLDHKTSWDQCPQNADMDRFLVA